MNFHSLKLVLGTTRLYELMLRLTQVGLSHWPHDLSGLVVVDAVKLLERLLAKVCFLVRQRRSLNLGEHLNEVKPLSETLRF